MSNDVRIYVAIQFGTSLNKSLVIFQKVLFFLLKVILTNKKKNKNSRAAD